MKSCIIIPARVDSKRLPRKLLLRETGKSLIEHTYAAVSNSSKADFVVVAADGPEMRQEVERFGGRVVLTAADLPSGTDRVAAAARQLGDYEIIVNVQAEQPEISSAGIDRLIGLMESESDVEMGTLATPFCSWEQIQDPARVKVVLDSRGDALYFSRAPIPHVRDASNRPTAIADGRYLLHLGVYAYRRDFLMEFSRVTPAPLEKLEMLEQLRALSMGRSIRVELIDDSSPQIDTAEDYRRFVERFRLRFKPPT